MNGAPGRAGHPATTLVVASLAIGMVEIDKLAVNVALPAIGHDLHRSFGQLQWTISVYMLTLAALLIVAGRLGDVYGRRRMFLGGLALFALSSLGAGLAQTSLELIGARALQGIGAAFMYPATSALLATAYPDARRAWAQGMLAGAAGLGMAIGPLLGGFLVETLSWRWVFFINPIVAVVAIALTLTFVEEVRATSTDHRIDALGVVALIGGLTALMLACIQAGGRDLPSALIALVVAVPLLALFVLRERRSPRPLIEPDLLRIPGFAGVQVVAITAMLAIVAWLFLTTLVLQTSFGASPLTTGLLVIPYALAFALLTPSAGRLTDRIGYRGPMLVGLVVLAAAMLAIGLLTMAVRYDDLWPLFALIGVAQALIWPGLSAATINLAGTERAGVATGILQAGRWLGGAFGVAIVGAAFAVLNSLLREPDALAFTLLIIAGLVAVGTALSVPLMRPASAVGAEVGQEQPARG